jgi:hypothetical protein
MLASRTSARMLRAYGDLLERADIGLGPFRFTPTGYRQVRGITTALLRDLLEVPHRHEVVGRQPTPVADEPVPVAEVLRRVEDPPTPDASMLRERFHKLLERSQRLDDTDRPYPAFAVILDQLDPDEARILRLFVDKGPQPVVDVFAGPRFGRDEELILEHASLVGDRSGCSHVGRSPAYLVNLERLGLIGLHDSELSGADDYELIEVSRPVADVSEAAEAAGRRVRFARRSARLTPLGERFCAVVVTAAPE